MILGGVVTSLDGFGPARRAAWSGARGTGNDLATRFPEDLAALAELGVRRLRIGFDWARLQPEPGTVDDDWREWYLQFLSAARRAGVEVWATLLERTVPAWFDDEGSFADARTAGRWWPRWVETAADLFGDAVAGWFPIDDPVRWGDGWRQDPRKHEDALVNLAMAWRDAWRILRGGPPVATAFGVWMVRPTDQTAPAAHAARLEDHLRWRLWLRALRDGVVRLPNGKERAIPDLGGALDVLGLVTGLDLPEGRVSDDGLRRWEERLGSILRRGAEDGPDRPMVLAGLTVAWDQADERRLLVEASGRALAAAVADGVRLEAVHVSPAIGVPPAATLLDRDREATPDTAAWLATVALRT